VRGCGERSWMLGMVTGGKWMLIRSMGITLHGGWMFVGSLIREN